MLVVSVSTYIIKVCVVTAISGGDYDILIREASWAGASSRVGLGLMALNRSPST